MGNFITNLFGKGKVKKEIIEDIIKEVKHTANIIPKLLPGDHPILKKALLHNVSTDYVLNQFQSVKKEHLMKFFSDRLGDDNLIDDNEYDQIKHEAHRLGEDLDDADEKNLDVIENILGLSLVKLNQSMQIYFLKRKKVVI